MHTIYDIRAEWDAEAGVWWATSEDVPGLAIESDTLEHLVERLKAVIPELLELNGVVTDAAIPFRLHSERVDVAIRA